MLSSQFLVLSFILLQTPIVCSSGLAWPFLTPSSKNYHGFVAVEYDTRYLQQSLLPDVPLLNADPYLSQGVEPSHHEALMLLKALGSRSTCHGEATSSLLVDCAALKDTSLDVNVKIGYAVRLAICEFKSTGVGYPSECKKLGSISSGAYQPTPVWKKCIKKLEEKPQHWTTLSNNIQNAITLCAAARHEIDKEELLSLHINITKIQQGLFNAVHDQLNEAWAAIQSKRIWDAEVKESQQDALNALHQLKQSAVDALIGTNEEASGIIEELTKQMQSSKESANTLSNELKKSIETLTEAMADIFLRIPVAWSQVEESTRGMSDGQIRSLQESGRLARELQDALEYSKTTLVGNLDASIGHLSASVSETLALLRSIQMTSMSLSESFTSLTSSYRSLESTESDLTISLQLQQHLHDKMISSIEKAGKDAHHSLESLVKEMERLRHTVEVVERKVHSFWLWKIPKSAFATGILSIFILVVLFSGKQVTWGVGVFSGLWALAMATALIGESHYSSKNSMPSDGRDFLLAGPEQSNTTAESFNILLYPEGLVYLVTGGGFVFLAFYAGYYRHWNVGEASSSSEDHSHRSRQQEQVVPRRGINDILHFLKTE